VSHDTAKRRRNSPLPGTSQVPDTPQPVSGFADYPSTTVFAETHTSESFAHSQNAPKKKNRRRAPAKSAGKGQNTTTPTPPSQLELEGEVAQEPKAQRRKRRSKKAQDSEPSQIQAGSSGSNELETQEREVEPLYSVSVSSTVPQEDIQASSSYNQHQIGYAGSVEEFAPSNNVITSHTPASLTTEQVPLASTAIPHYSTLMSQALVPDGTNQFGLTNTPGGGYYTPLDVVNQTPQVAYPNIFYQLSAPNIAQFSSPEPYTSSQTEYDDSAAAAVPSIAALPTFMTGHEAGGATTHQTSVSQSSDQGANLDQGSWDMAGTLAGEHTEAPYSNVPVYAQLGQELFDPNFVAYESSYNQPQPNHAIGFDANGGSNLSNLIDNGYQHVTTPTAEQNLMYDGFPPAFYLQPQSFAPSFSGPSW
jgi:hypothetical protein